VRAIAVKVGAALLPITCRSSLFSKTITTMCARFAPVEGLRARGRGEERSD
jgi:hypothetical protein